MFLGIAVLFSKAQVSKEMKLFRQDDSMFFPLPIDKRRVQSNYIFGISALLLLKFRGEVFPIARTLATFLAANVATEHGGLRPSSRSALAQIEMQVSVLACKRNSQAEGFIGGCVSEFVSHAFHARRMDTI
jgi:hypothetical protein